MVECYYVYIGSYFKEKCIFRMKLYSLFKQLFVFKKYAWCICIVDISSNSEIYSQVIKTFYLRCIMKNEHKKWFINFLGWAIAILSCHEFSRLRNACYVILFAISSAILHIYYTLICHSLCILRWESFSFLSSIYYNNPFLNWIIEVDGSVFC